MFRSNMKFDMEYLLVLVVFIPIAHAASWKNAMCKEILYAAKHIMQLSFYHFYFGQKKNYLLTYTNSI